ncbi:isochorismatase [Paenibacillus glacialis]|uniref:isochorismatase n=1 Tax=Paenibacillus glacialis TaxID=494026 RepID=A0A168HPT2_9BACL|nr:isochorismatase [Paenibacillus glacialis]OAB38405.1 Isochorismatase [Paenibacillus glacialis]
MAIPNILPYPMPVESDLPTNKVGWTIDPKRAVLLIHDMQQYFLDAFDVKKSPVVELIANIQNLRKYATELGIPVIYSAQPGGQTPEQRGLLQDFWGSGINGGPDQKQIVEELSPRQDDIVLTKWRYSAFQKTDLLKLMEQQGRDQLIVCGIYAHIGCLLTSCEAFMQDIQPFFIADAVADFSLEKHSMAMTYASERCAVTITTQQLIEGLNRKQLTGDLSSADTEIQAPITLESLREEVARIIQEQPNHIGIHDDLINIWGIDSIRIMSLVEGWRRRGIEITFVELAEQPTISDWWALMSSEEDSNLPNVDYFNV